MLFILPAIVALIAVLAIMPNFISTMKERGFVGKDMNKFNKPMVAELGGAVVFLGFTFGILSAIFLNTYLNLFNLDLTLIFAGFFTISIIVFIGLLDDIIGWKKGIRQWQHALFPIIAALPLMAVQISNPPISLPIIGLLPSEFLFPFGVISFGLIYSLIFIPIGVTGASNATNMLAGLNGLEAGLGFLIIGTLGIISFINGKMEALIFAVAILGALIGFLKYNWFPAKIFGGDSLTLMTGASIAVISIISDMEKIGIMLLVLFFVELYLKSRTKFQGESFGKPTKNGFLLSPKKKESLTHYFMGNKTEKQVVKQLLFAQFIVCLIVMVLFLLNTYQIIII